MTQVHSNARDEGATPGSVAEAGSKLPLAHRNLKIGFVALLGLALIVAAIAIGPHFTSYGSSARTGPQLATSATRSFPVSVTANGTVVLISEVPVDFAASGTVTSINVTVGGQVKKGEVLATLDSTAAQNAVAQAQSALASANATLATAKAKSASDNINTQQDAVNSASAVLAQTQATVQAVNSQDAAAVKADSQAVDTDQAQLSSDGCNSAQPPNQQACQSDQSRLQSDQSQLKLDEARAQTDAQYGQLRIEQAQSQLTQAQAQLSQAKAAQQASSGADTADVSSAQAAVSSATSQLSAAQAALAARTLVAPVDGTVNQVNGAIGQNVSPPSSSSVTLPGTSTPVPQIAGLSSGSGGDSSQAGHLIVLGTTPSFAVGTAFSPSDAKKVTSSTTGTITSDSASGSPIPCHVLAVGQAPVPVNGGYYVYVTVIPDGDTSSLQAGSPVSVSLNIGQATDVLSVPLSAVYLIGGVPHVDVWVGHRAVPTVVSTGQQGTNLVEILSGLSGGEQVVISGNHGIPGTSPATQLG